MNQDKKETLLDQPKLTLSKQSPFASVIDYRARSEVEYRRELESFIQDLRAEIAEQIENYAIALSGKLSEQMSYNLLHTGNGELYYHFEPIIQYKGSLTKRIQEIRNSFKSISEKLEKYLIELDCNPTYTDRVFINLFRASISPSDKHTYYNATTSGNYFADILKKQCKEHNLIVEIGLESEGKGYRLDTPLKYFDSKPVRVVIWCCVDDTVLSYAKKQNTTILTSGTTKKLRENSET